MAISTPTTKGNGTIPIAECSAPGSYWHEFVAPPAPGYWESLFAGFDFPPKLLVLPGRGDEAVGSGVAEKVAGSERMRRWADASAKNSVYFESMVLTAWGILLSRYLRMDDVAFHAVWAGSRAESRLQFPVRIKLEGRCFLQETLLAMEMQTQLSLGRTHATPMAVMPELETGVLFDPAGSAGVVDFESCGMGLAVEARRGVMRLFYRYVLPTEKSAERMLEHLFVILDQLATEELKRVSSVELLSADEWRKEMREWNETAKEFPPLTLHESFALMAAEMPEAVAVQSGGQVLTYGELDAYAGRLALKLRYRGAGPGERVAIVMERSFEYLVGMLAVMKSGAAYVPVDPQLPDERRGQMLRKSGVNIALMQVGDDDELCRGVRRIRVDLRELTAGQQLHCKGSEDDCAYVIFTSGSSGEPKGVAVRHSNATNEARSCIHSWGLERKDVLLQFASLSFDVSVEEIWTAWLSGSRLVLRDEATLASFEKFSQWVEKNEITVLNLPTAFWHSMVTAMVRGEGHLPKKVRLLVAGGEEASAATYAKWRAMVPAGMRFVNAYGPTETAVTATIYRDWCDPRAFEARVPIGRPVANTSHYVVDQYGNPQPQGVPGELWISGAGVATGYVGERELTSDRFFQDPYGIRDERLYRTGDLVFADEDGTFYYLGRCDRQVKVRGYRIEPGEVEAVLREHPEVSNAHFACRREAGGSPQLCAWVTATDDYWPSEPTLKQWLADRLPSWMQPSAIITMDKLPLTMSGKIDESALPTKNHQPIKSGYLAKEDERMLAQAWKEVIGAAPQMRETDFFEMGGDSLSAMALIGIVRQRFNVRMTLGTFYSHSALGGMIDRIRELINQGGGDLGELEWNSLVEIQPGQPTQTPLFLVHGIGGGILWGYRNLTKLLPRGLPVIAVSSRANDDLPEFETLDEMLVQYMKDLRQRQPVGPYRLGGYCLGGNIAHEMACLLEAEGEEVELVYFDAYPFLESEGKLRLRTMQEYARFSGNIVLKLRNLLAMTREAKVGHLSRMCRWGRNWVCEKVFKKTVRERAATLMNVNHYTPEQVALWGHHINLFADRPTGIFQGNASLLRTRSQPVFSIYSDDLGWGQVVKGKVNVDFISGHHETIFLDPDIRETAEAVRNAIKGEKA
jgi:amino acid adenylation domain-containing protein